ncbi:MAG: hypothetical protein DRO15_00415 [Thermoprotei archaeon]|nr:MAG: hypothetical protein DRO15_00415 [Thermoprotei archaeon]
MVLLMRRLWIELAIATVLLLLAVIFVWNYYDIFIFMNWVRTVQELGLFKLYAMYRYNISYRVVYFPLAPLTFIGSYSLGETVSKIIVSSKLIITMTPEQIEALKVTILRIFSKLPLLLSAYLIAYILYKREGWEVTRWWLYNIPLFVTIATYQFDPIMVFFLLLGSYYIAENKWIRAGIAWGLGAAIKYIPLPLVPIAYLASRNRHNFIRFLASLAITVGLIATPFMIVNPQDFLNNILEFHGNRPPQYLSIFNIPVLLSNRDVNVVDAVTKSWPVLFILIYALVILLFRPKPGDKESLFRSLAAVLLVFIIFSKVVNPNYLLWAYPFLVCILVKKQSKLGLRLLVLATIIATIWPGIYLYVPAVLGKPAYIEEVMQYYNARILIEKSFQGLGEHIILKLLELSGHGFGPVFEFLYMNLNLIGALLIISYALMLFHILIVELGNMRSIKDIVNAIRNTRQKLLSLIREFQHTSGK